MRKLRGNKTLWELLSLELLRQNYFEKKRLDEMRRQHDEAMNKRGTFRVTAAGDEEVDAHLAWLFEDKKPSTEDEERLPEGEGEADSDDEATWVADARRAL
jgi:DNA-binding PadR family transcriptional regulator